MSDAVRLSRHPHRRRARRGVMTTAHGDVETPAFMPVGTQGAVKGVTHRDLEALGAEILLEQHLSPLSAARRRSDRAPRRAAPLHRLDASRSSPTAAAIRSSASPARRTIDEEGAHFQSHLDGSAHLLTPEKAADIQAQLGSDIAMVLDECLALSGRRRRGARRRWSGRCAGRAARRERFLAAAARRRSPGVTVTNPGQAQFGIVQGGVFPELRRGERAGRPSRSASRRTRSAG